SLWLMPAFAVLLDHSVFSRYLHHCDLPSFPTRRSSDLGSLDVGAHLLVRVQVRDLDRAVVQQRAQNLRARHLGGAPLVGVVHLRSEEHTSELQSHLNLVCRLLLEKKKSTVCCMLSFMEL